MASARILVKEATAFNRDSKKVVKVHYQSTEKSPQDSFKTLGNHTLVQARNQLGTPGGGGRRVLSEGPKIIKHCPKVLNYVQHIFSGEAKPPSYGPALVSCPRNKRTYLDQGPMWGRVQQFDQHWQAVVQTDRVLGHFGVRVPRSKMAQGAHGRFRDVLPVAGLQDGADQGLDPPNLKRNLI